MKILLESEIPCCRLLNYFSPGGPCHLTASGTVDLTQVIFPFWFYYSAMTGCQ